MTDSPLRKGRWIETATPLVGSEAKIMVVGRIHPGDGEHLQYPILSQVAGFFRSRGFTVLDPSTKGRGYKLNVAYAEHVDHHLELAAQADAIVLAPKALSGRIAALVAEYASMTGKPLFQCGITGKTVLLSSHDDTPLWTSEIEYNPTGKKKMFDPMKDVRR